jgi:hypothetical protein
MQSKQEELLKCFDISTLSFMYIVTLVFIELSLTSKHKLLQLHFTLFSNILCRLKCVVFYDVTPHRSC